MFFLPNSSLPRGISDFDVGRSMFDVGRSIGQSMGAVLAIWQYLRGGKCVGEDAVLSNPHTPTLTYSARQNARGF
jgi:hypothetical protein